MRKGLIRAVSAAAAALLGAGLSLTVATTAFAHAEVEVEPARAGATDALVTVFPEAHNHDAGAVSVEVFLPEGIEPADVTLASAPAGWELTTGEESYTVSGDELEIDVSPRHEIRVRQVPDAPEIHFRILVSYSDGQVDRWIELPSDDNPSPSNAAPGVELAAAEAAASPTPAPNAPSPVPAASPEVTEPVAADGGGAGPLPAVAAAVAVLVAAAAGWAIARRRTGAGEDGPAGGE